MACSLKARSLEDITNVKLDYPHCDKLKYFKTYLCYYFKLLLI